MPSVTTTVRIVEGTMVTVRGEFRRPPTAEQTQGDLTDPDEVKVHWKDPSGEITTFVYGTDAEVVRESLGVYAMDYVPSGQGKWWYQFEGVGLAVKEDFIMVTDSQFD